MLGDFISDFSSDNANGIMKRIADAMPERDLFERQIRAMLAAAQVASSVEVRNFEERGAGKASATLDWFLELRRGGSNSVLSTQRRRQLIHCSFEQQGKRWKFTAISPVAFFAPPQVD